MLKKVVKGLAMSMLLVTGLTVGGACEATTVQPSDAELLKLAVQARQNAYTPYSHFQVGAALVADSGKVYLGCNIENAAYGPSNCAERTAIFKAVSEGERRFTRIAVVGALENGDALAEQCFPCGVCRQVLNEFCPPDCQVVLADKGKVVVYTLGELLPHSFGPDNLK